MTWQRIRPWIGRASSRRTTAKMTRFPRWTTASSLLHVADNLQKPPDMKMIKNVNHDERFLTLVSLRNWSTKITASTMLNTGVGAGGVLKLLDEVSLTGKVDTRDDNGEYHASISTISSSRSLERF